MDVLGVIALLGIVVLASIWQIRDLMRRKRTGGSGNDSPSLKKKPSATSPPSEWPRDIKPLPEFDWQTSTPTQHRPFKPIYHITMALQSTSLDDLIVMDSGYKERIEYRRKIIAKHPEVVLGVVSPSGQRSELDPAGASPRAKALVDETYSFLMDTYLATRFPTMFEKQTTEKGVPMLHNKTMGTTFPREPPADPLDAFRILCETVEDDIFLLDEEPGTTPCPEGVTYPPNSHRLSAFLCIFAAGFDPSTKLGKLLRDIHKPVPSYDRIGPSMERIFSRLEVGKSVKRLNWSIQTHTELYTPGKNHVYDDQPVKEEDVDIETARMRVECQTVTRLPKTRGVLFTFKTYLFPVKDIKAEGMGPGLADAIQGLKKGNAPGMWTYKGGVRWGDSVCKYLRS